MEEFGRSPNDRSVLPIMDRHGYSSKFAHGSSHLFHLDQVQKDGLFTNDVPSPGEGIEDWFAVPGRRCANIDEINLEGRRQVCRGSERLQARNRLTPRRAPAFSPINYCNYFHAVELLIGGPMSVLRNLTETNDRTF